MKRKLLMLLCGAVAATTAVAADFSQRNSTDELLSYNITSASTAELAPNVVTESALEPTTVGLTYSLNYDNASYTVSGTTSDLPANVIIPSEYNGLPVTAIADRCFWTGRENLRSVIIPNTVTSIDEFAFYECSGLTGLTIPASVTSIGFMAFYQCTGLSMIKVENDNPANIALDALAFNGVPTSQCVLYVPRGSKALYAAADQWKEFVNILEMISQVTLIDGEAYENEKDAEDIDVTYVRNFNNTEWQALYVPFNMSYEEWSEYAEVAEVHNVRGYDDSGDGVIDDIVIEFNKVTSGEITPNVPYVIKAKSEGEVRFECTGKTLFAAPAEEGSVDCSSTKMTYSFHGVYQPKYDLYSTGAYHLAGGAFCQAKSATAVLSPYRFYLMVTPRTGGYNPASAPKMIRIMVDGEDVTSSIEGVGVDAVNDGIYYDMMGRKVANPTPGIYIQNGKKVYVK